MSRGVPYLEKLKGQPSFDNEFPAISICSIIVTKDVSKIRHAFSSYSPRISFLDGACFFD